MKIKADRSWKIMDADAVMLTVMVCWLNETFQQQWFWYVGNKKTYTLDL